MYKIQGSNWRTVIHDSWSILIISQNTFSKFSRNSRITNHFLIARYGSNIVIQYRFKQWAAQQKHFICLLYLPDIYPRSGVGALAMKVRLALHLHLNLLWLRSLPYFHSAYQWTGFLYDDGLRLERVKYHDSLGSHNLHQWIHINSICFVHLVQRTTANAFLKHVGEWIFKNLLGPHPA